MNETMSEINELVQQALKLSGSKQRFSGIVQKYDLVGTTIFIESNGLILLAFVDNKNPLTPGDAVTFRIDGMRAIEVQKDSCRDAAIAHHERRKG